MAYPTAPMTTITFFEHQKRSFSELGWSEAHPALEQINQLNQTSGVELIQIGYKYLKANQYVGVIRLENMSIQILPKMDYSPEGDSEAALNSHPHQTAIQSATQNLLYFLSYTENTKLYEQDIAGLLTQEADWFEIMIYLFASRLHRSIKRGVERSYVAAEETLPVIKGRWQIDQQLKKRPYQKHLFGVKYDEFSENTELNQIFLFVTEQLLFLTQNADNRRLLRDIKQWFIDVTLQPEIPLNQLDNIHFNRLNKHFKPVFNLARLFIENQTIQLRRGKKRTFAFVFDMNRLFEEFIYQFLSQHRKKIFTGNWKNIRVQYQLEGKTTYLLEKLPEHKHLSSLKPDILVTRPSGSPRLIVDAKYKKIDPKSTKYNVDIGDIYQMISYGLRFECQKILLVYPQWRQSQSILTKLKTIGKPYELTVATINLAQPLNKTATLVDEFQTIFREEYIHGPLTQI